MDPLSEVLSFLELRNYRVGGFEAGGDWSIRFDPYEGIKCYAVTSGACWLAVEGAGEAVLFKQGDCLLLPRGSPFRVASDPALPPEDWKRHFLGAREGALVKLNDGGGVTVLGGHFQLAGPQAEMLLGMLPPIVHLQSEGDRETLRWAFDRMRQELVDPKPGAFLIVQQLAYMIFVQALRLHLDETQRRRLAVCALRQAGGGGDRGDPSRAGAALDGGGAGPRSRHVAIRFRGAIWAIGRRWTDRISDALADAARRTQPVARRTHRRRRPLARL